MLAVIAALLLLTAKLGWTAHTQENEIESLTVEVSALKVEAAESKTAAATALAANFMKLNEAKNAARIREKKHQDELAAAKSVSDGLRANTQEARGVFQLDGSTQTPRDKLADFGYDLLDRCENRYITVAGRTAEYVNYIQELLQAWPTKQSCTSAKP